MIFLYFLLNTWHQFSPDVVRILHITRGDGRLTAKSDTPKRAKKGQKQPEKGQKQGKTGVFRGSLFLAYRRPKKHT
jgi:hypothetical protein